jgi:large subunit ribosomal protein L6
MSRIGRRPIEIPGGVTIEVSPGGNVKVSGPLGTLEQRVPTRMQIAQDEGVLTVTRPTERGEDRALHGLTRTLVANMVEGVTKGFEKQLEIQGVGYRAQLKGTELELAVGFSHPVTIAPREGISFEVPQPTQVIVKGTSKQVVGQTAAEIRKVRPPEPYKGKGIRYRGEHVRRKVGKRA